MFQGKYDLAQIEPIISEKIDCFFMGDQDDERSNFVLKQFKKFRGEIIRLHLKTESNELSLITQNSKGVSISKIEGHLLQVLPDFFKKINIGQKNVLLDITSMQHSVMFLLIKMLLKTMNPKTLYASYVEPATYIPDDLVSGNFNLSDKCLDIPFVPGFTKRDRGNLKVVAVFMGFEGYRLHALLDDKEPQIKKVVPIVGFPSYQPGWKGVAIKANYKALSDNDCENDVINCEAASPYKAYKTLEKIASEHDEELVIVPLGTRPHALGAAIFASLNSHCKLIYDHPLEKTRRSEGVLRAHVYDLSRYISGGC